MLVVIDTNVLVSGIAYPGGPPGRIVAAWRAGAFGFALSGFLLDELARVLTALSPRIRFSADDTRDFLDLMRAMATVVEFDADALDRARGSGLRDPDDLPVLATLLASGAQCLVTGDKDLLALRGRFPIMTPVEFVELRAP